MSDAAIFADILLYYMHSLFPELNLSPLSLKIPIWKLEFQVCFYLLYLKDPFSVHDLRIQFPRPFKAKLAETATVACWRSLKTSFRVIYRSFSLGNDERAAGTAFERTPRNVWNRNAYRYYNRSRRHPSEMPSQRACSQQSLFQVMEVQVSLHFELRYCNVKKEIASTI